MSYASSWCRRFLFQHLNAYNAKEQARERENETEQKNQCVHEASVSSGTSNSRTEILLTGIVDRRTQTTTNHYSQFEDEYRSGVRWAKGKYRNRQTNAQMRTLIKKNHTRSRLPIFIVPATARLWCGWWSCTENYFMIFHFVFVSFRAGNEVSMTIRWYSSCIWFFVVFVDFNVCICISLYCGCKFILLQLLSETVIKVQYKQFFFLQ